MLAAAVVAPGALLAAPLQQAFSNFMVGIETSKVMPDTESAGGEGRRVRYGASHRHQADSAGGGGAHPRMIATARLSAGEGLLKLTDLQTDVLNTSLAGATTLVGDDDGDGLMSKSQARPIMEETSSASATVGRSSGGGFGGGFGGGSSGGGSGGGAPGAESSGSAGLGGSAAGPDTPTDDPSLLGDAPAAPSAAPEPAAWVSLILGFGLVGSVLRARRRDIPLAQR
ncbi:PEPxxWA-CTERM sorting domain-containing protein [Phenylobacterium sp.]|uniref:PEPxxWA-CTERM sorting domain-containing protein n=1 Tax=Phenylobacterium sp. TaxID=1871053 RepID=UPI002D1FA580|nr:PEPxxWA-CTERM sorting domain-containing protein [Phenylobacterium sp.]